MPLPEITLDQRRRLIDAQQRFRLWREADREFRHSYKGAMTWKRVGGKAYLYRIMSATVQQSLGPRSEKTERLKESYVAARTDLRARVTKMRKGIVGDAALNRAAGLARVPRLAAKIARALDRDGLLGNGIHIVGTHALYAYEARSGVIFESGLLATTDLDLLTDVRTRLVLALDAGIRGGILPALMKADRTFRTQPGSYQAVNDDGYIVDVIRPMTQELQRRRDPTVGGLTPVAIQGLEWLVNAPRFDEVAIAEDGEPVWLACVDPRAFALHKLWVSKQPMREAQKRPRDVGQAIAVAQVADLLGLEFKKHDLSALPKALLDGLPELRRLSKP